MTDRIPLDNLTSDQLDALYDQRDQLRYDVQQWRDTYGEHALRRTLARLHDAEGAVGRVRQMADAWEQRLPDTIRTATAVEALRVALDRAQQPTTA